MNDKLIAAGWGHESKAIRRLVEVIQEKVEDMIDALPELNSLLVDGLEDEEDEAQRWALEDEIKIMIAEALIGESNVKVDRS